MGEHFERFTQGGKKENDLHAEWMWQYDCRCEDADATKECVSISMYGVPPASLLQTA